ncbi:MAG: MBOAT family protein, partial [Chrysiogenales bacterium]
YFGIWIDRAGEGRSRVLIISIVCNLLPLVFFKYTGFIVGNINALIGIFGAGPFVVPRIHLPIGISFFTFSMLSYVIDLHQGKTAVERNPLSFAVFFAMFPKMLQGPIERYTTIAQQLVDRRVGLDDLAVGVRRFITGLGKKILIANVAGAAADKIFAIPAGDLPAGMAWFGILCYTMQIYFDFAGYTDMAIGIGRMFGFRLMENFNYPYAVRSFRVFWQRWHISLASWFMDYVYIPLGGSRVSRLRSYFNLLTVFFLTGLWHGSAWTFVVWGTLNGVFLVFERMSNRWIERIWKPMGHAIFIVMFFIQLSFFRSESIGYAFRFIAAMFGFSGAGSAQHGLLQYLSNNELMIALFIAIIGSMPTVPVAKAWIEGFITEREGTARSALGIAYSAAQVLIMAGVLVLSCMAMASDTYSPFIYFQF